MQNLTEDNHGDFDDENDDNGENSGFKRSFNQERHGDPYGERHPNKRMRPNRDDGTIEMRCVVPAQSAGGIIGKGGSNIKDLRQTFHAQIQVPDSHTQNRILRVQADIVSCGEILLRLLPVINDPSNRSGQVAQDRGGEADLAIKVLVHQTQAGAIIGTKGANIKELREKTGAHIKVHQDCCPNSTDRVCQISGKSDAVISCVTNILQMMQESPPLGAIRNYDPEADSYGGGNYDNYNDWGNNGGGNMGGGGFRGGRGGGMGRGRGGGFRGNRGGGYNGGRGGGQRGGGGGGFRRGGRGGGGGYRGGRGSGRNNNNGGGGGNY